MCFLRSYSQVAIWRGDADILDALSGEIKEDVYYIDGKQSHEEVRGCCFKLGLG